ncbi:heptaprenyl diphosphate synthase component II [Bacillus sp. FJAT-42376]|uniref:heptaprenyl diphosphate synthase component II n=1 Tax=Bacillus sp. FJAT-42376 TaxID=2014076 RepID=UPI000F511249|nr:heptaprenyl diphosphate synthase component II [Bacillus sp. FJAT-42376]AZB43339.1 heptaprenyl diphosphate synthase component II [Bacillus sp. FJAT-42376]
MKFKNLYTFLNKDLDLIEQELEKVVQSNYAMLSEAGLDMLQAGGKRIRPVFVLLSGMFGDYRIEKIKDVAVALEIIHMATLVHDDVIDDAELRRGKPTIKARWDNRIAMYTGDYLFAKSLELMTELHDPIAHKILSRTIVDVVVGEIEQLKDKYRYEQSFKDYLKRIKRKTAILIATSCQLGAIAAGTDEFLHKKLYLFGYNVGMSFQIIDDILDFTSTEKQLGKPVGSDLLQGNITLPVLIAMKDNDLKAEIMKVGPSTKPDEIKPLIEAIKKSGAIEQSYEVSNRYLEKAFALLNEMPSNKARSTMHSIAKYIGKRKI